MGQIASNQHALRGALGRFVTGVTIVTGRANDGRPVGLTCNSFNSVSLDPPLVLWSLAKTAYSVPAFMQSGYFAVNVLGVNQIELAHRFASASVDKFKGVKTCCGLGGVPLLEGALASFECQQVDRRDVGDHWLFIGKVLTFSVLEGAPLLFHGGKYGILQSHVF